MMPRPSRVGLHQVVDRQRGLAEELGAALVLQHQKLALHRSDRGGGDVAVLLADLLGVLRQIIEQLAQILEVDQSVDSTLSFSCRIVVGELEGDVDDAFLRVVEAEHARDQQRPHLEQGGADRMALLAEQVPEHHREFVGLVFDADVLGALQQEILRLAGRGDAGQVALDVGGEHRNAGAREPFGQHLQRHGLAGAGRAGRQAVPVGQPQREVFRLAAFADENLAVRVVRHCLPLVLGSEVLLSEA